MSSFRLVERFVGTASADLIAQAGSSGLGEETEALIRDQLAALSLAASKDLADEESPPLEDSADVISLNVGGQSFYVPKAVAAKEPGCRLNEMTVEGGPHFVDRDPQHFPLILHWLSALDLDVSKRPLLPADNPLAVAELMSDAKYFGILSLVETLTNSDVVATSQKGSFLSSLGGEWSRMREDENRARAEFMASPKDTHPFLHLLSVFDEIEQFVFPAVDTDMPLMCLPDTRSRTRLGRPGTSSLGVSSISEFRTAFYKLCPALEGISWDHIFVAGGGVVHALMGDQGGPGPSDVDLFLYGLQTEDEAIAVLKRICDTIKRNVGKVLIVRTSRTLTVVCGAPSRHVQVILRMYHSPAEVLLGFDLDAVSVGFDGDQVWCLPRCRRAFNWRLNIADPSRQTFRTTSYEYRLWKYSKRGFAVGVPGFVRSLVNTRIYLRPFRELSGFARLLFLEERDFQNRIGFTDQRWGWHEEKGHGAVAGQERNGVTTSILDSEIVADVIDYNHGVLLPFHAHITVSALRHRLEDRATRVLQSLSADQPFNHREGGLAEQLNLTDAEQWNAERKPHLYFIFGEGFEEISDTNSFAPFIAEAIVDPYDGSDVKLEDIVIDVPQKISFIGSLQEYIASLPDVVDDWYGAGMLPDII